MLDARTDCFSNLSLQERFEIHYSLDDPDLERVFRTYFGWVMLPFAILANIVTPIFIYVVFKAIKARRVSRKCYILLLNRSVSDQLSSLVAIGVCSYVILADIVNRDVVLLIESMFIGSFWTATVSYVALSLLKLLVIWKPLQHRNWFTMRRCKHIIIFSWLFYAAMVSYAGGTSAMVKLPTLSDWSGCKIETCLRFMYRSRHILTIFVYTSTLFIFVSTVLLIKKGQRHSIKIKKESVNPRCSSMKSTGSILARQFPLWKLALNIINFAVMHFFYVMWCVFRLTVHDRCYLLKHFLELVHIMAFVKYSLMCRIIFDPILSLITDTQLRRCLLLELGCHSDSSPDRSTSSIVVKPSVRVSIGDHGGVKSTVSADRKLLFPKTKAEATVSFGL